MPFKIMLDDSSQVQLFPSSVLRYRRGFEQNKRDVHLIGKAVFTVAHNEQKPFTVFTKNFSTAALGTIFMIEADKSSKISRIQLLQGKVAVRNMAHLDQVEYLLAGQECSFNEKQNTLRKTTMRQPQIPSLTKKEDITDGTYEETSAEIIFKNLSLPKVLNKLSNVYQQTICFKNKDVEYRKFSGTVDKHHSLETVLNNLSYLNDLKVEKETDCFRISLQTAVSNQ
jgi:ferric-dicitrate binding protein FerR (iron transport regulator)